MGEALGKSGGGGWSQDLGVEGAAVGYDARRVVAAVPQAAEATRGALGEDLGAGLSTPGRVVGGGVGLALGLAGAPSADLAVCRREHHPGVAEELIPAAVGDYRGQYAVDVVADGTSDWMEGYWCCWRWCSCWHAKVRVAGSEHLG